MKHQINKYLFLLLVVTFTAFSGCHNKNSGDAINDNSSTETGNNDGQQVEYVITKEQFRTSGMQMGSAGPKEFREIVTANGYITPSPNGHAKVGSFIPGKVTRISVSQGERVKKGDLLFIIKGSEIIMLQQEYAEAFSRLVLLKSNLDRQKILSEEKISAEKELILAESEYIGMLARTEGLKERLKMININSSQVENGTVSGQVSVYAPISGYITELDLVVGQSIDPTDMVLEIMNPEMFQLKINVFKKDIGSLIAGQPVNFYEPDKKDVLFRTTLSQTGKTIDKNTRAVVCIATIKPADRTKFVSNSFVEAEIVTCTREVVALPEEAFIEEAGQYYVLIKVAETDEQYTFRKTLIKTGVIQNSLVEVLDEKVENVLIKGLYNIIVL